MPCWYFEKKDIKSSPSFRDGVDTLTEARYRREGARFIIDAGTKLGLRYDSCATGVVYFHRFYMFHSFKEFHRYVTAACCLFLAGKVEETPKKCRDIIKICQSLLSPSLFAVFGEDPREEVMTMERILLQTIKFDLQIEHPYSKVLKYAKFVLGDKEKIQKMVQMAWTFINDSMCTTLSLQWEPDIIATSLLYLASRLTKFEITDWQGKIPGTKIKWWDAIVEDISMELMEDICHQVLDLYSPENRKKDESPSLSPQTSTNKQPGNQPNAGGTPSKNRRANSPAEGAPAQKQQRIETKGSNPAVPPASQPQQIPVAVQAIPSTGYTSYNPYVNTSMYSSSFMSQEGNQKIQALFGQSAPAPQPAYPQQYNASRPPPSGTAASYAPSAYAAAAASYTAGYQPQQYAAPPPAAGYNQTAPYPGQQAYQQQQAYPQAAQSYSQPPPGYQAQYQYPPQYQAPTPQGGYPPAQPGGQPAPAGYPPGYQVQPPTSHSSLPPTSAAQADKTQSGLATVRITQRR